MIIIMMFWMMVMIMIIMIIMMIIMIRVMIFSMITNESKVSCELRSYGYLLFLSACRLGPKILVLNSFYKYLSVA